MSQFKFSQSYPHFTHATLNLAGEPYVVITWNPVQISLITICIVLLGPVPGTGQDTPHVLAEIQRNLRPAFSGWQALETVAVLQKFWRHGGNEDFNAAMTYLASRLKRAGFSASDSVFTLSERMVEVPDATAWQPELGALFLTGAADTLLHWTGREKMTLAANSHSTPPGGIDGRLVWIDSLSSIPENSLKGTFAYTRRPLGSIYAKAVVNGGAIGIVSSWLPEINRPERNRNIVKMAGIPYRNDIEAFGFSVSSGAGDLLESALRSGPVTLRALVQTTFQPKVVREVTAVIKGVSHPSENIVMIAHVDEPGANDNASGSGTLLETALHLRDAIHTGRIQRPARSLKFMWVEEIRTVRRLAKEPGGLADVTAAIVLDMTGQNTAITGGTFLVERMPDPSAIWTRPPDKHSEWGAGQVSPEDLRGSYLNDLFLIACSVQAAAAGWQAETNPFEGGSDHVPFLKQGVPAVLAWHFTDQFYHSSGDDLSKVSPSVMANVGLATASTALFIADCDARLASSLLDALHARGFWRLRNALRNGTRALAASAEARDQALKSEREILTAWADWYAGAFESVGGLPIKKDEQFLRKKITATQTRLRDSLTKTLDQLEDAGSEP